MSLKHPPLTMTAGAGWATLERLHGDVGARAVVLAEGGFDAPLEQLEWLPIQLWPST